MQKYKARLVDCDNDETGNEEKIFSPVPDFTLIRLIMVILVQRGRCRRHLDFQKNAFFNGKLHQTIWAELQNTYTTSICNAMW